MTPDQERELRGALRGAHNTDLVNEGFRIIGRTRAELRRRTIYPQERDAFIDQIIYHYRGRTQRDRDRVVERLARLARRREEAQ